MRKIFIVTLILVLALVVSGFAKWKFVKNFPDDVTLKIKGSTGAHGLAVDPEGKVWVQLYGTTDSVLQANGKWGKVRQIFCFYPDGKPAPWNGRKMVTLPDGKVDTLWNSHRGLGKDPDGNILWTAYDVIYRIDYKTGDVLQKIVPKAATTLCAPAADEEGNIYASFVLPGNPIMEFDKDGNLLGNVTDKEPFYGRTLAVSKDGLTVYSPRYSGHCVLVYKRQDKFSAFNQPPDTLFKGFDATALYWHPVTGKLWMDCGTYFDMPNRFPNKATSYVPNTVYELDLENQTVTDSVRWNFDFTVPNDPNARTRAVAFSPDGNTCYVGCFGADNYPPIQMFQKEAGEPSMVTFSVNMSIQEQLGKFNPASNKVVIRGNFNGWSGDADECLPTTTPHVYALTKDLTAFVNTEIQYKYVIQPGNAWETIDNRKYTVKEGAQVLPVVCFDNRCSLGCTANVTFQADVSDMLAKGFNPATDKLYVLGGFNGWAYTEGWATEQDLLNPTLFVLQKAITAEPGTKFGWKFRGWPQENFADNGWEGGSNHEFIFNCQDIVLDPFKPAVIPAGKKLAQDVKVIFSVDCKGAKDWFNKKPFPSIDGVYLNGDFNNWAGTWSVEDTKNGNLIKMYDDGTHSDAKAGDNIWTCEVQFKAGDAANRFYKYGIYSIGYTDTLNRGNIPMDNEAGFAMNHSITISDAAPVFVNRTDKFGSQWLKVERLPSAGVPAEFALHQNYPNPFNPTTAIVYDVARRAHVRLAVYNMRGQLIKVLYDGMQTAGSYRAEWDGTDEQQMKVPSGIYLYRLDSEGFSKTMKMTLMK